MKKFVLSIMACLLLLSLSACRDDQDKKPSTTNEPSSVEVDADNMADTEASDMEQSGTVVFNEGTDDEITVTFKDPEDSEGITVTPKE